MLKKVILTLLLAVFVSFTLGASADALKVRKFQESYMRAPAYQSPFDPSDILRDWDLLTTKQMDSSTLFVLLGNPLINWSECKSLEELDTLLKPKGSITKIVIMVFIKVPNSEGNSFETWLGSYGYHNAEGKKLMYVINKSKTVYELTPVSE